MRAGLRGRRTAVAMLVALGLVVSLVGCSADQHVELDLPPQSEGAFPDETTQQLKAAVEFAMAATGSSGAIVGVWAPWSGSWVSGLGTQRPDGGAEVTDDMQFRAGKVTRAMTCDILYGVADAGTVSLDDSVSTYVAGVPQESTITLRQLCDGTSGIGSYGSQLRQLWLTNPKRVWDPRELAGYGLGEPRATEPGAAYVDSDAGYVLLGLALERATGRTAAELIQQYVVDPLDLVATHLPSPRALKPAEDGAVLTGYQSLPIEGGLDCANPLDITQLSASVGFTDAGVVSTIADLGRYGQALATGALLADGVERFGNPLPAYPKAPAWNTATGGAVIAGSLIGQYGAVPGYLTAVFSDPVTGLTVALVLNNSAAGAVVAASLAWELAAIASKAPAGAGETAPEAGLPWTAQQYHDVIAAAAVCPLPAP
jgi:D-alanyl-D-alanine carboxypeptidase